MNERIFELNQSQNDFCAIFWTKEDKEELTKLIMRECPNVVENIEKVCNLKHGE